MLIVQECQNIQAENWVTYEANKRTVYKIR